MRIWKDQEYQNILLDLSLRSWLLILSEFYLIKFI